MIFLKYITKEWIVESKLTSHINGLLILKLVFSEQGYTYKNGLQWECQNVSLVLKNPLYAGMIVYKGCPFPGQHEAIVSEETFLKVKNLKSERNKKKSKYFQSNSLLAGLLFCGNCGGRYYNWNWHVKYKYYICYSRGKPMDYMVKDPACKNKTWKMEELDGIIESEMFRLCKDIRYLKKVIKKPKKKDNKKEIIEAKIKQIDKQIDKLLDLYQIEETSNIKKIGERISKLNKEKEDLQSNLPAEEIEENFEEKEKFIKTIPEMWENSDLAGKRFILEKLIKKIILVGKGYEIHWNL
ncbi:MAG TPA: recombinase family protein [Bacteroidales bacterium]|nr:recombinase family protein [Petrotogaceae bacterium]HQJ20910.1 recombinase family protein [Bacteroidales bacterium]